MYHASFNRVFAAAHRVWNDPGKCANIHGHNYRVKINVMTCNLTDQNFTVPLDTIKEVVDALDHSIIIDQADPLRDAISAMPIEVSFMEGVPSTEFLAQWIADAVAASRRGIDVTVELQETDSIVAWGQASS